nr:sulfotransferase [uncultured Psychroserpens sp.]
MIKPNTFIIGAQKSATTSVYNWIAQHPDVCGPSSLKDYPFFTEGEYNGKDTTDSLSEEYMKEGFSNQKIVLQGYVNYMFYKSAIANIHSFDESAKLICVLRNPTDRAVSAYNYFKKLNLEPLTFREAINREEERKKGSLREKNNLTYKEHGLYASQLQNIFLKFKREQVLILFYEDVSNTPEVELVKVFEFLNIDKNFSPNFKQLNVTGKLRYKFLHNILFNQNKIKKFIVNKLIDPILPLERRINIKLAFVEWNTSKRKKSGDDFTAEKHHLNEYFRDDIIKLEKLTDKNLDHWK